MANLGPARRSENTAVEARFSIVVENLKDDPWWVHCRFTSKRKVHIIGGMSKTED